MHKKIQEYESFIKNEGVAMARQMGVENAVGEYSIHVDADDWIDSTMLEELHKKFLKRILILS